MAKSLTTIYQKNSLVNENLLSVQMTQIVSNDSKKAQHKYK